MKEIELDCEYKAFSRLLRPDLLDFEGRFDGVLSHFGIDVGQNLARLLRVQLLFEPAERDADYVAVVKFGAATGRTQFQPEPVRAIDVFGP